MLNNDTIYASFKEEIGDIHPYIQQIYENKEQNNSQIEYYIEKLFSNIPDDLIQVLHQYQLILIKNYVNLKLNGYEIEIQDQSYYAMQSYINTNASEIISSLQQSMIQKMVQEYIKLQNELKVNDLMVTLAYYSILNLDNICRQEKFLLLVTFSQIDYIYFINTVIDMLYDKECNQDTIFVNILLQIVINVLQPLGQIIQSKFTQQHNNLIFRPTCLIAHRKRFMAPYFNQFLSHQILLQMQQVVYKRINYQFLLEKLYNQITFECKLEPSIGQNEKTQLKQKQKAQKENMKQNVNLSNQQAINQKNNVSHEAEQCQHEAQDDSKRVDQAQYSDQTKQPREEQQNIDIINKEEPIMNDQIGYSEHNSQDDSKYFLSSTVPQGLAIPQILPIFHQNIYFNGLFIQIYKEINTQFCIKNTNSFDPIQLANIFLLYHNLQQGNVIALNKNQDQLTNSSNNEQNVNQRKLQYQYISIRDDTKNTIDPNSSFNQQNLKNQQIDYIPENMLCTISYYIIASSMCKQLADCKISQKFIVPCQSLISFCKQCKLQEDDYNQILDLLEFDKSDYFLLIDTKDNGNNTFNSNINQTDVSSIFAFASILLQMYNLNTLEIYLCALSFIIYQSKENLWIFLHKIPLNIFYLEESTKRVSLQKLIFNYFLFLIGILDDHYSILKKFILYQYLYETYKVEQYLTKIQEYYQVLQTQMHEIKYLPSLAKTEKDIDLLLFLITYKYCSPAQNITTIVNLTEHFKNTNIRLDYLFFIYCEQFLLLPLNEQQTDVVVSLSYTMQTNVLGKYLKQIETKPIYMYLHALIQCMKSNYSSMIIQMLCRYALCHGNDNYNIILLYNALVLDKKNFIIVQMLLNWRVKTFQIKKVLKQTSHSSLFVDLLPPKQIQLLNEQWKEFENMDISQLADQDFAQTFAQFNILRQQMNNQQTDDQEQ